MQVRRVNWYQSLSFKGMLLLALIALCLILANVVMMRTQGEKKVAEESSHLLEEIGNNIVIDLDRRVREIAAVAQSLAIAVAQLPRTETAIDGIIPSLIDHNGAEEVIGGGVWFEPFAFDRSTRLQRFSWYRDPAGQLARNADEQPSADYDTLEWYVVARRLPPGRCFWSRVYVDPYANQLAVKAAVPIHADGSVIGVATILWKLDGLQARTEYWQRKTGSGYLFFTDLNNKLITFPDPALAIKLQEDTSGQRTRDQRTLSELAKLEPLFQPIAVAAEEMNRHVLDTSREMPGYDSAMAEAISTLSQQTGQTEAELIAAVITDPLVRATSFQSFEIENDYFNEERSLVSTFYVPDTYWKLIIVRQTSAAATVASRIVNLIIIYLLIVIVPIIAVAYLLIDWFLLQPLARTGDSVRRLSSLVADQQHDELRRFSVEVKGSDEIAALAEAVSTLHGELNRSYESEQAGKESLQQQIAERKEAETSLLEANQQLEELLAERTTALEQLQRDGVVPAETAAAEVREEPATEEERSARPDTTHPVPAMPLLQVWDGIALLLERGPLDGTRADTIIDSVTGEIEEHGLRNLILCLRGISLPDAPAAAANLARVARSLRLLGVEPVLVGVPRPLAAALADQDFDPGRFGSFSTIPEGLRHLLTSTTREIRSVDS